MVGDNEPISTRAYRTLHRSVVPDNIKDLAGGSLFGDMFVLWCASLGAVTTVL